MAEDQSGLAYFERAARTQETTSPDAKFSKKKVVKTPPLDGALVVEERGKPKE